MKNIVENQGIKTDKPLPMSYEALKAERDALAVENAAMREALDSIRIYSSDTLSGPSDSVPDMAAWLREGVEHLHQVSTIETPATSAALAAIDARGVEKFAAYLWKRGNEIASEGGKKSEVIQVRVAAKMAEMFVEELREAK
ncbi:hypothetical protein EFZ62_16195 [Serratia marcescens]|uniref:hypothetical protein n=1 Tax=Serratia marcescens TaxID=615 RepID=UPI0013181D9F|nr:hypothetical protein [Serratia marcescens]QHC46421.1 hypothetical protein EFZ62_16195 [Serratia marcescens]